MNPLLLDPQWQETGPVVLPAGLTSDWNPFGIGPATEVVIVTPDPSGSQLDGMLADGSGIAPAHGAKRLIVQSAINHGQLTFLNAEGSVSAAANRFYLHSDSNISGSGFTIGHRDAALFIYDAISSKWKLQANAQVTRQQTTFGSITDVALAAVVNDYAPIGIQYTTRLRLAAAGAPTSMTGILGNSDGTMLTLQNFGGSSITLLHNNAGSAAGNRFFLPASLQAGGLAIEPAGLCVLQYDAANGFWYVYSRS